MYHLCLVSECVLGVVFFFQAEDGIRDLVRSRGLGDVYKRQEQGAAGPHRGRPQGRPTAGRRRDEQPGARHRHGGCLLYTSDAADERSSVDLGGRRIIKKKNIVHIEVRWQDYKTD